MSRNQYNSCGVIGVKEEDKKEVYRSIRQTSRASRVNGRIRRTEEEEEEEKNEGVGEEGGEEEEGCKLEKEKNED